MNKISWISRGINITRFAFWLSTALALILVPVNRYALSSDMSMLFTQGHTRGDALIAFAVAVAIGFFSYVAWILLGILGLLKIAEARFSMSFSRKVGLTSFIVGIVLILSFFYLWLGQMMLDKINF